VSPRAPTGAFTPPRCRAHAGTRRVQAQKRVLEAKKEQDSASALIAQCREDMVGLEMERKALDRREMQIKVRPQLCLPTPPHA